MSLSRPAERNHRMTFDLPSNDFLGPKARLTNVLRAEFVLSPFGDRHTWRLVQQINRALFTTLHNGVTQSLDRFLREDLRRERERPT